MNLSSQVTNYDLSKKLADLGVNQTSIFCYQPIKDSEPSVWPREFDLDKMRRGSIDERIAAFSVAELLDKLPPINGSPLQLLKGYKILDTHPTFCCRYDQLNLHFSCMELFPDINPANACAKMLIYLIENGYFKNET